MDFRVVVRGGGDLASGVVLRLAHAGMSVVVLELPQPLAVRRLVSFAEAVHINHIEIEGLHAGLVNDPADVSRLLQAGRIPVLVDPQADFLNVLNPQVLVDGRMLKKAPETQYPAPWTMVGLGPGFVAGKNCDAAIETQRGHFLGRVIWHGSPEDDTGQPEQVANFALERVLRAPDSGVLEARVAIGDIVEKSAILAVVKGTPVLARFRGVVRGMLRTGQAVVRGMKIGDLDPRCDPGLCSIVSDKALSIGGGVLEAILSVPRLREAYAQAHSIH
jgi:xanthine dehydrogenase accessory factor